MDDEFWSNRFHWCALAAGFIATAEGRIGDSLYVRKLTYSMFEEGAFRDRVSARRGVRVALDCARRHYNAETGGEEA